MISVLDQLQAFSGYFYSYDGIALTSLLTGRIIYGVGIGLTSLNVGC